MTIDLHGYRFYDDGASEPLGRVPTARLGELLTQAQTALRGRAHGIALYRDARDFLEARPLGEDRFAFHSQRLTRRSLLARLLRRGGGLDFSVASRAQAVAVFVAYVGLPRAAFERKAADLAAPPH
ncbi:hypothetical protein SAMN04487939_115104 [Lysobacter sp. yr284]|uniref:hypothetical protein n=1 Tax=Lysobacter sp. yr284 TaxID=1761791 RepID=UPI00089901D6|nr:hypothetical protein [Lysobacter sp. yr284]SDZ09529.1 hypothetical protein SAMN04487939_115104 [Lysobacter sp. yr284]